MLEVVKEKKEAKEASLNAVPGGRRRPETVALYCPNCGKRLQGKREADGAARLVCSGCGAIIFSKQRSPRKLALSLERSES